MSDQADGLRELVRARSGVSALADPPPPPIVAGPAARSMVMTSGKGGVGTSNLALNLAIALGERGSRVVSELGGAWKRWPGCLMNALPYITDAVKVALPRALIGSIVVWRPSQRRR